MKTSGLRTCAGPKATTVCGRIFAIIIKIIIESIIHEENSYTGEAVNRLTRFENIFENLVKSQEYALSELEKLRAADNFTTI